MVKTAVLGPASVAPSPETEARVGRITGCCVGGVLVGRRGGGGGGGTGCGWGGFFWCVGGRGFSVRPAVVVGLLRAVRVERVVGGRWWCILGRRCVGIFGAGIFARVFGVAALIAAALIAT